MNEFKAQSFFFEAFFFLILKPFFSLQSVKKREKHLAKPLVSRKKSKILLALPHTPLHPPLTLHRIQILKFTTHNDFIYLFLSCQYPSVANGKGENPKKKEKEEEESLTKEIRRGEREKREKTRGMKRLFTVVICAV